MKSLTRTGALLLVLLLVLSGCGKTQPWDVQEAKKGVVRILSSDVPISEDQYDEAEELGFGSGFGVGTPGEATDIFITNRHVVISEDGGVLEYVYILLEDDSWSVTADNIGYTVHYNEKHIVRCQVLYPHDDDPEYPDLAVLRAERVVTERVALPMKSGSEVKLLDKVYTLGFPGSTDSILVSRTDDSVELNRASGLSSLTGSGGEISSITDVPSVDYTTLFLHTAQINHGNSGGPLLDENGYVIGINTYGWNYSYYNAASGSYVDTGVSEKSGSLFIDYAMMKLGALGISYSMDLPQQETDWMPIICLCVGAAVLAVTALIVLVLLKKKSAFQLQGTGGVMAGKSVPIRDSLRIGRDPNRCNLVYPASASDISGLHCELVRKGRALTLRDCRSTNGTYLNGRRLADNVPTPVKPGDRISLASPTESFTVTNR